LLHGKAELLCQVGVGVVFIWRRAGALVICHLFFFVISFNSFLLALMIFIGFNRSVKVRFVATILLDLAFTNFWLCIRDLKLHLITFLDLIYLFVTNSFV